VVDAHGVYKDISPTVVSDGGYSNTPPDYPAIEYSSIIDGGLFKLLTGRYRGDWAQGIWYQPGDMVVGPGRTLALCLELHLSDTTVNDIDSDFWGALFSVTDI